MNSDTAVSKFRSRDLLGFIVLFATALGLIGVLPIDVRHDEGWIDAVTGSTKRQERWFGITTSTVVRRSAIEDWIIRHEGTYTNHWSFADDTAKTIFGQKFGHACGFLRAIHPLRPGFLSNEFVRNSTDDEMAAFLLVMRTGTDAEKELAVEAAWKLALASN